MKRREWKERTTRNSNNKHTTLTLTHGERPDSLLHATILMMSSLFLLPVSIFTNAHLWQISNVICIEQQLLETPRVTQDFLWHVGQRAMSLIHKLHLTIAPFEDWNALEHCWICLSKLLARRFASSRTKQQLRAERLFLFYFITFPSCSFTSTLNLLIALLALYSFPAFYIFSHILHFFHLCFLFIIVIHTDKMTTGNTLNFFLFL